MYRWEGDSLVPFAHGGLLHPLNAYPQYIDLKDTDKYGKPGATEAALANGIPYGIQPTYWPGMSRMTSSRLTACQVKQSYRNWFRPMRNILGLIN